MSTWNRLDLETLGSRPILPNKNPGTLWPYPVQESSYFILKCSTYCLVLGLKRVWWWHHVGDSYCAWMLSITSTTWLHKWQTSGVTKKVPHCSALAMTSGKVTGKISNVILGSLNHVLGEVDTSNQAVPKIEPCHKSIVWETNHNFPSSGEALCIDYRGRCSSS